LTLAKRTVHWLFRPWWPEPREEFERRWQRFFLLGPVGGLVGLTFGILAARRWELSLLLFPVLCGITGTYLMYLAGHVESFVRTRTVSPAGRAQVMVALFADLVVGGLLGQLMAIVLDANAAAMLGTGAATLAAYTFVASRIFWGDWIEQFVYTLSGQASGRRINDYSYEMSLAAQGFVDEALERLSQASVDRGGHSGPLILGAHMLEEEERYEDAVAWYRRASAAPRLDARRAAIFARNIAEISAVHLGDPAIAVADLQALLDTYPTAEEVAWARDELEAIQSGRPSALLAPLPVDEEEE
jgi:hypothetical protein